MKLIRVPFIRFLTGWYSSPAESLRGVFGWLHTDRDQTRTTDPDFDAWVANDPMVTMDPASRYGDDATGFLSGREDDDPKPVE